MLSALYDQTAALIVRGINLTVGPGQNRVVARRKVDPPVYEAYLRGRVQLHHFGDATGAAIRSFEDAITRYSTFAPAHGSLALACADAGNRTPTLGRVFLQGQDRSAQGHRVGRLEVEVMSRSRRWRSPPTGTGREPRVPSIERSPWISMNVDARTWRSSFLLVVGRFDEAISDSRAALDADPVSPAAGMQLGYCYMMARRYDEAVAQDKRALELEPGRTFLEICSRGPTCSRRDTPRRRLPLPTSRRTRSGFFVPW